MLRAKVHTPAESLIGCSPAPGVAHADARAARLRRGNEGAVTNFTRCSLCGRALNSFTAEEKPLKDILVVSVDPGVNRAVAEHDSSNGTHNGALTAKEPAERSCVYESRRVQATLRLQCLADLPDLGPPPRSFGRSSTGDGRTDVEATEKAEAATGRARAEDRAATGKQSERRRAGDRECRRARARDGTRTKH